MVGGQQKAANHYTYGEIFDKAFPQYLAMGMTSEEYWEKDCTLTIGYREAYKLKIKDANFTAWLQGRYIYDALGAVSPLFRAFGKKAKAAEYHKKPYDLFPEDVENTKENEYKAEGQKIMSMLKAMQKARDKSKKK